MTPKRTPRERVLASRPIALEKIIGRWMGFAPVKEDPRPWRPMWAKGVRDTPGYQSVWPGPPHYASRLDDAAQAEAQLVLDGHGAAYVLALQAVVRAQMLPAGGAHSPLHISHMVLASAETRARAVVLVLLESR